MTLRLRIVTFCASLLALLLVHVDVVRRLVVVSRSDETASHLIAVPFVTVFLIYVARRQVFSSTRWSPYLALPLIVTGGGFLLAERVGTSLGRDGLSLGLTLSALLLVCVGGFALFFGGSAVRKAMFPLLFLVFTVPVPTALLNGATAILRDGSTATVATLFTLTGTPYYREGSIFTLPAATIEVADECSGIRSTIALLLTSLLAGYMLLTRPLNRALLVAAIIPVTILKNGIRIVALSLLAMHVDPGFLHGKLHHRGGIVFFLLGLVILAPILLLMLRSEVAPTRRMEADSEAAVL